MANELRQALNKVTLTGVLKENKLGEGKSDKGEKYINGSIVLKCGEFTEIEVEVFVSEFTKEGKVKKNYSILKDIIDGNIETMGKSDYPAVLSIYGSKDFVPKLKEKRYANQTKTETTTRIAVDLGFGNIKVSEEAKEEDYQATFDIEMFVTSVEDEVDKEENETGRVKVKGYVPTYNGGIFPVEVIAGIVKDEDGEFDFGSDIRDEVEEGTTLNVWGDINFGKIIEKKKKGGKLGRAKTEDSTTYIHELVATGADFVEDDNAYEEEDVEKAVKQRKIELEEVLTKAKEKEDKSRDAKKGSGLGKRDSESKSDKPKRQINF